MKYHELRTCTTKCRSSEHADQLAVILSKTDDLATLLSSLWQCCSAHKVHDSMGRSMLHLASMYGRARVCEWLVRMRKADVNVKTLENGWTPTHCACFYGHVDTLIALIRLGANLAKNDFDRLTPAEGLAWDRWMSARDESDFFGDELEVYSWGSNVNFTLANHVHKSSAEAVDYFVRSGLFIRQVATNKFHSIFLTTRGLVYTCGFGMDGRLGHGDELTLVAPKLIDALKDVNVVQVAASRNNSYFLSADGTVYSCGSNEFKQLAHTTAATASLQQQQQKALVPKRISIPKMLKGKQISQIACSRFHCVLLTSSSEVYCFGLNAGQLGFPNDMIPGNTPSANAYNSSVCYISEPRLVTSLKDPDMDISLITCSDGCTVCIQPSKNLLYILNEFKTRRLHYVKETGSPFIKVRVIGGRLDRTTTTCIETSKTNNADSNKWIDDLGSDPITIVGLTDKNLIFMWREQEATWRCLNWSGGKQLRVVDFDLHKYGIIVTTIQGTCYKGSFKEAIVLSTSLKSNQIQQKPIQSFSPAATQPLAFGSAPIIVNTETLDIERIPLVNRCAKVVCDLKGRNFFALQYQPTVNMRYHPEKSKSTFRDNINEFYENNVVVENEFELDVNPFCSYDLSLLYKENLFKVHKFILLSRASKFFIKLDLKNETRIDMNKHLDPKFSLECFEILLKYVYGCKLDSEYLLSQLRLLKITSESSFNKFLALFKEVAVEKFGFVELKTTLDPKYVSNFIQIAKLDSRSVDEKLKTLADCFHNILHAKSKLLAFNRNSYAYLQDCLIICNCNQEIKCHKYVLIARCDFFHNMFMGGWLESNLSTISLPFDVDLMQILIDYLYTDELHMDALVTQTALNTDSSSSNAKSRVEKELELAMNTYVLADQLLVARLKNLCEFKLAYLVNLKNVAELLEFAARYDAQQLKEYCLEFCARNLVTLIDSRLLENISENILVDLGQFYRSYFRMVEARRLTPYSHGLEPAKLELIPLDLLYDERFLSSNDDFAVANTKRKIITSATEPIQSTEQSQSKLQESEFLHEFGITGNDDYLQSRTNLKEEVMKWEKVKKKGKKKTVESNNLVTNESSYKNNESKTALSQITSSIKKISIEPLKKSESSEEIISADLNKTEWPDLSNSVELVQNKTSKLQHQPFRKLSNVTKAVKSEVLIASKTAAKAYSAEKSLLSWGNSAFALSSGAALSLQEVINEELNAAAAIAAKETRKQATKEEPTKNVVMSSESPKFSNAKTWANMNSDLNSFSSGSFAKILEMEKTSEEQYNKQKKRQLNSIQIEERAIEELKKLYNVDNLTDMTISIELVEDAPNMAPIWKKK